MSEQRCLILLSGEWPHEAVVGRCFDAADYVIACDGALNQAMEKGYVCDAVLGDMDSVEEKVLVQHQRKGGNVIYAEDQDATDFGKALQHCITQGFDHIDVLGGLGGDEQHMWGNLFAAVAVSCDVIFHTDESTYHLLLPNKKYSIEAKEGGVFSLFAIPECTKLNVNGCMHSLKDETLSLGSRGVHNVAVNATVEIKFESGNLVLIMPR